MSHRVLTAAAILAFAFVVVLFAIFYGPSRRVYLSPPRIGLASTPEEILSSWETAGVRGRTAVLFTRRLNATEPRPDGTEFKYLELSMRQGRVRRVFHLVPDAVWPDVSENLSHWPMAHKTPSGFVLLFDPGRVDVRPLSRWEPLGETSLVVVEPPIWGEDDRRRIAGMIRAGVVQADLVQIIRGSAPDLESFSPGGPPSGH